MDVFRCSYCDDVKDDSERSAEHPLSQTLGGRGWATRDVCSGCNEYAGRNIDAPFARQTWILYDRHRYEIPDARGTVPQPPRIVSRLKATGERVLTVMDKEGVVRAALTCRDVARRAQRHIRRRSGRRAGLHG